MKTLKGTPRSARHLRLPPLSFAQNWRNVHCKSMSAPTRLCSCRGGFAHADEHIVFPDSHLNPDFDPSPLGPAEMFFLFLLGLEAPLDVVAAVLD